MRRYRRVPRLKSQAAASQLDLFVVKKLDTERIPGILTAYPFTPHLTHALLRSMLRRTMPTKGALMTEPGRTPQTLDRLDQTLQGLGDPYSRALAVQLDRLRAAMAAVQAERTRTSGDVGSDAYFESRFRAARHQVTLQGQISDLIAHVNMLVNDPTVGPDARAARNLLRTLTVA